MQTAEYSTCSCGSLEKIIYVVFEGNQCENQPSLHWKLPSLQPRRLDDLLSWRPPCKYKNSPHGGGWEVWEGVTSVCGVNIHGGDCPRREWTNCHHPTRALISVQAILRTTMTTTTKTVRQQIWCSLKKAIKERRYTPDHWQLSSCIAASANPYKTSCQVSPPG